jgi:hypothetical protein
VSDGRAVLVLAAAQKAAATRLVDIHDRDDCMKALSLQRDWVAVALLRDTSDEDYAAIVASVRTPARGPKTPPGFFIDLDAPPKGTGSGS